MTSTSDIPIVEFSTANQWRQWLTANYANQAGVWLRLYKKNAGITSLTHAEALDQALCFGWIDGQAKKLDDVSWIIKFTPRREKSMWSKRNKTLVERLIQEKQMTIHGLKEIDRAKKDGRWDAAYDSPKNMTVPQDFVRLIAIDTEAHHFYKTLNKANLYAIAWRLQTARTEKTREHRFKKLVDMMKNKQKLH